MENIVVDTNCLIMMVSARSSYNKIWKAFLAGDFCMCLTTEIIEEYIEVLARNINVEVARYIVYTIMERRNTRLITNYYHWHLIEADPDDNKFVDCAITAGARFLVTEDHHFSVLRQVNFPVVDVIGIDAFLKRINTKYS